MYARLPQVTRGWHCGRVPGNSGTKFALTLCLLPSSPQRGRGEKQEATALCAQARSPSTKYGRRKAKHV